MTWQRVSLITIQLLYLYTATLAAGESKGTAADSSTNNTDLKDNVGSNYENTDDSKEGPISVATTSPMLTLRVRHSSSHSPHTPTTKSIERKDIKRAGCFLLPVSLVFTLVNGFLVGVVCSNWAQISSSSHYSSTLLCLLLTLSDLLLSGLLGLPIGVRFAFEEQLRGNKTLHFYTEKVGFLIFEYLLIFRMLIIAFQSLDRCLNIMMTSKYHIVITKRKIHAICAIATTLPLLRILPVAYVLCAKLATVHCYYYNHYSEDRTVYYTPLTCLIDLPSHVLPNFGLVEIIIVGTITTLAWIVIVVSNTFLLIKVFRRAFQVYSTVEDRAELNKGLINSCALMVLVAFSFALTNFPFFAVWAAVYVFQTHVDGHFASNYRLQFYLILLTFLSLFFHPWLYLLRIRSIRELVGGVRKRALGADPTALSRVSTSYQDVGTLADPELKCRDQETRI